MKKTIKTQKKNQKEKINGFEFEDLIKLAEEIETKAEEGDEDSKRIIEEANKEWGQGEYAC